METFRMLQVNDLGGLMSILTASRETGEGQRALPWYWLVRDTSATPSEPQALELEAIAGEVHTI